MILVLVPPYARESSHNLPWNHRVFSDEELMHIYITSQSQNVSLTLNWASIHTLFQRKTRLYSSYCPIRLLDNVFKLLFSFGIYQPISLSFKLAVQKSLINIPWPLCKKLYCLNVVKNFDHVESRCLLFPAEKFVLGKNFISCVKLL